MCLRDKLTEIEEEIVYQEHLLRNLGSESAKEALSELIEKKCELQDELISRLLQED